jgi:hypothetical protein
VQQVEPAAIQDSCSSSDDVIRHPVMFVTRLDPTNPYHHTQVCLARCPASNMLEGLRVGASQAACVLQP